MWFWLSITCIKNTASPLNWISVCKGSLDLFKKVLRVSVGQLAVKVGGLKKILPIGRPRATQIRLRLSGRIFFKLPTLTAYYCAVSWSTEIYSTSLERSKPPKQTEIQLRGLAGFFIQVMLFQSDLIYIGLML